MFLPPNHSQNQRTLRTRKCIKFPSKEILESEKIHPKASNRHDHMNEAISPISNVLKITLVYGERIWGEQVGNRKTHACINAVDQAGDDFELGWVGDGRGDGDK